MLLKFTHLHYKFILSPPAQHKSQKPIEYEWGHCFSRQL